MKVVTELAPFAIIALLFWLLLIRPAQRRQRQMASVQQAAEPGSEVMLTSGIFGTVLDGDDETVRLEIAPGTVVRVARGAVARVTDVPESAGEDDLDGDGHPADTTEQ